MTRHTLLQVYVHKPINQQSICTVYITTNITFHWSALFTAYFLACLMCIPYNWVVVIKYTTYIELKKPQMELSCCVQFVQTEKPITSWFPTAPTLHPI